MPLIETTIPPSPMIIENLESNSESTKKNRNSLFSDEEHTTFHSTYESELDDILSSIPFLMILTHYLFGMMMRAPTPQWGNMAD